MRADRPSLTARVVARGVVFVADDPRVRQLLPAGSADLNARLLLEAGVMKPWMVELFRRPWCRRLTHWLVRHSATGLTMTLPLRKRFMDDEVRRAIDGGARQLLVVGAGFDTLAPRIAGRYPGVQCFEIDHPATQRVKRAALQSLKIEPANLHLVSVDLASTDVAQALSGVAGWRVDALTVAVAEGLLCYLDESDVSRLLAGVRVSTAPGSTLLLTHMRIDEHGEVVYGRSPRFMRAALRAIGEPVKWAIRPDALAGFLRGQGYTLDRSPTTEQLRTHYLEGVGLADAVVGEIERMVVAKVA